MSVILLDVLAWLAWLFFGSAISWIIGIIRMLLTGDVPRWVRVLRRFGMGGMITAIVGFIFTILILEMAGVGLETSFFVIAKTLEAGWYYLMAFIVSLLPVAPVIVLVLLGAFVGRKIFRRRRNQPLEP